MMLFAAADPSRLREMDTVRDPEAPVPRFQRDDQISACLYYLHVRYASDETKKNKKKAEYLRAQISDFTRSVHSHSRFGTQERKEEEKKTTIEVKNARIVSGGMLRLLKE